MGKIKNILISQPAPVDGEKSPYKALAEKHKLNLVFRKFIKIEGVPAKDFRQERLDFLDYTAVIFTSRNAVDYYFRMANEMRWKIPITMKYFCSSETTAYYLQNYIQYRKRKIFFGKQSNADLMEIILKHKEESFLLPCSDTCSPELPKLLTKYGISFSKAELFRTVPDQIASEINIRNFDLLVFFSPIGIKSLYENYPNFKQGKTLIAAYGSTTWAAMLNTPLHLNVQAPSAQAPSMIQALDDFITLYHKQVKSAENKGIRFKSPIVDLENIIKSSQAEKEKEIKKTKKIVSRAKTATDGTKKTSVSSTKKVEAVKTDRAMIKAKANKEAASKVLAQKKATKNRKNA